jgi:hypothetical protein
VIHVLYQTNLSWSGKYIVETRETRERCRAVPPDRWNWGKWGLNKYILKGHVLDIGRWARCAGTRDFCPALPDLVGPVQNFFPLRPFFHFICSHRPPAGQAVVPCRLSLNMCLWLRQFGQDETVYKRKNRCETTLLKEKFALASLLSCYNLVGGVGGGGVRKYSVLKNRC